MVLPEESEMNACGQLLLEEAAAWAYWHDLFRSPCPGQWAWLTSQPAPAAWMILAGRSNIDNCLVLPLPATYDEYAVDFVSTFEVGMPQPPCPLIESHWNKRDPVPRVLHENMLYYKQFGLALRSSANETADHLRHQLEFMHYLCRKESEALAVEQLEIVGQFAQARSDYVARHLGYWLPQAYTALKDELPDLWCTRWIQLLSRMCQDHFTSGEIGC